MNVDDETYILLLLSDSNLPTGSFVASSGLESYVKHGFYASPTTSTINFIEDSLGAYAHSALPFVSDAHRVVESFKSLQGAEDSITEESLDKVLNDITALDNLYEVMTLNHVARRASKSQGVALLTLYSNGFSRPPSFSAISGTEPWYQNSNLNKLLEKLKQMARREETYAHLPICWGMLTAALGLSLVTMDCRALSIPSPISSREESAFGVSSIKRHRALLSAAAPYASCPTIDYKDSDTM
ncbi:hypothetical protein H0H92_004899 [Tricholoma furcatifolium]|nr:hypothetical protein H0H92_004899 [Tricholoma furcatifolium]